MAVLSAIRLILLVHYSCKACDPSSEGCEPVSGGIPVTNIKLDIDSDREVEKIHSLFLQYMEKLEALQGMIVIIVLNVGTPHQLPYITD